MAYNSEDHAARRLLSAMRKNGITLPRNPQRAAAESQSMMDGMQSGSLMRNARARYVKGSLGVGRDIHRFGNQNGMQRTGGGNIQMALPMKREPLGSLREKGIPFDIHDEEELQEVRRWCRVFKATHYLIPLLISIYARFPIQGMSFQSKDPQIKAFYEELFFDRLDYETYMIDFGEEFFTIGEVNSLASFNETLGVWDNEEIINPDDLIVQKSPFSPEDRLKLRVPQTIRDIIENTDGASNPRDMNIIQQYYPEFMRAVRGSGYDEGIDVSSILLNRTVQKSSPWDTRGTPQMLRCFRQLMSEESLNAAQDSIADRLYSPLILAKLGSPDLGDGEPWIPDPEELEEFRDDMQMAMASDFRFLSYHFGLDIQNVFGREAMPRLGEDYDRIERKILQVWGIGEELISGSNSGTYASSALNREFLSVPPDVRAPILQPWRGPCLRTMEEVWNQAAHHRTIQKYGEQEVIDFPLDNNSTYTICFNHGMGEWGKIRRIMRHPWDGPIVHLTQKWGEVRVTANHSVYASNGALVEPGTNPELLAVRHMNQKFIPNKTEVTLSVNNCHVEGEWSYKYWKNGELISYPGHPRKISSQQMSEVFEAYHQDIAHDVIADKYHISRNYVRQIGTNRIARDWRTELATGNERVAAHQHIGTSKLKNHLRGTDLENFMTFLGAWLAEGSVHFSKTGSGVITISNSNFAWLGKIAHALPSFIGDDSSITIQKMVEPEPGHQQVYELVLSNQTLATWLVSNAGKGAANKRLPDFIFSLDKKYVDMLLEEMIFGDGTIPTSGNWRYFSLSEELIHGLSLLCLFYDIQYTINKNPVTQVYGLNTCQYYDTRPNEVRRCTEEHFSGWVYDFEMEDASIANFTIGIGHPVVHNTQMMSTYQKYVENHIRKRCEVVAEAQGHFDYELSNGVKVPIYEEIYEVDEEGQGHIRKRPKLLLPDIRFASINLRDESTERQFLMMLKQSGVPISDQAMMTNIPFEFDDELEQVEQERVKKILAEARSNVRAIAALESENLPLSSEMQMIKEQMIIAQNDATSGVITPPETVPPAAPDAALMSTPAPNIAPDETNQMPVPGTTPQSFPDVLPRNQIAQRPEISDEMRANAPRMSKKSEKYIVEGEPVTGEEFSEENSMPIKSWYSEDPWVVGSRNFLKEESVSYFVEDRPWEKYLPAGARKRLAEAQASLRTSVAALESGEHAEDH